MMLHRCYGANSIDGDRTQTKSVCQPRDITSKSYDMDPPPVSTPLRVLELYSGIGGMHCALRESCVNAEIVAAVDVNTVANRVYAHNFPDTPCLNRNVESLTPERINKLRPDAILMSPPCQPFTRNGLRNDTEDPRTDSLSRLVDVLSEIPSLKFILLENVQGFERSKTRQKFVDALRKCNFHLDEFLLNPLQYGVPNSRLRYYCLAWRRASDDEPIATTNDIYHSLPYKRLTPECFPICDILEDDSETDQYALQEKHLKHISVLDVVYPDSRRSCCFTKAYTHFLEGTGSVYSPKGENQTDDAFKITNESTEIEKLNILQGLKLRFFSPKEVARLMSFPEKFEFPDCVTERQRYKLLGNSVNVKVVTDLIIFLINR